MTGKRIYRKRKPSPPHQRGKLRTLSGRGVVSFIPSPKVLTILRGVVKGNPTRGSMTLAINNSIEAQLGDRYAS
jgi:hypothetical protein